MHEQWKALVEKANKARIDADAIAAPLRGTPTWPAEKEASFNVAIAEFQKFRSEADGLKRRIDDLAALDKAREEFTKAAPTFATAAMDTAEGIEKAQLLMRKAHKEGFNAYVRGGDNGFRRYADSQKIVAPTEVHAHLSNNDEMGGFLVPDDFRAQLLQYKAMSGVIRGVATVITTMRDSVVWPVVVEHPTDTRRSSGFVGRWRQQQSEIPNHPPPTQNQPRFRQLRIPVNRWQPLAVEMSPELLSDSAIDIEKVLSKLIAETKGIDEDDAFLNGDGVVEPEGLLTAGLTQVNSGAAASLTHDGMIDLWTGVPIQYRTNARYMMNSRTYGGLLKLADTSGAPLIAINSLPDTLWGKTIIFNEGMSNIGAGNDVAIFGDFSEYIIVDREGLRIQRLIEAYVPNIGFLPIARVGGQVAQIRAFRLLRIGV